MENPKFQSIDLIDFLFDFSAGNDSGRAPIVLPKNQMSFSTNTTIRGGFVTHRPPFRKIPLEFLGYTADTDRANFEDGKFQGCCVYNPDSGIDSLMAQISGRLFKLPIVGNTAQVIDVSIPGDLNSPTADHAWMDQAEQWVVVTNGTPQLPIFYGPVVNPDLSVTPEVTRRSNAGSKATGQSTIIVDVVVPAIGAERLDVFLSSPFTGKVGDIITIDPVGGFTVKAIDGPQQLDLVNYSAQPIGSTAASGNKVTWITTVGTELPAGRMFVYGMCRIWMSMLDGKQFIASDLLGGSSGTLQLNFRDAVLKVTENDYLLGGGLFAIPGSYGAITAMRFAETLDVSLGQGALQVFTGTSAFSCNAPVDRLTWQTLVNPILTESVKGGGATSQWSTINVNSDIMFRAKDGIWSQILARREFNTWGIVPVSREVQPQLSRDSESLLRFLSQAAFDNRTLMQTEGVLNETRGTYFTRFTALNLDPVSTIRGKEPSVYDTLYWQGLNVFRIVEGTFGAEKRCFLFTLNNRTAKIELWELLPSLESQSLYTGPGDIYDDGTHRIVWEFDAFLDFGQKDPRARRRLRLDQAELFAYDIRGNVDFQAYWKPDFYPCWQPWHSWQECFDNLDPTKEPMYKWMGLPEPSALACDVANNRPLREGYQFQFKLVVTGSCKFGGGRFSARTVPQPPFERPGCLPICPDELIANLQS